MERSLSYCRRAHAAAVSVRPSSSCHAWNISNIHSAVMPLLPMDFSRKFLRRFSISRGQGRLVPQCTIAAPIAIRSGHSSSRRRRKTAHGIGLFRGRLKWLLDPSQDTPADEGVSEFEKCFVNIAPTFEANGKTAEVVWPCVSTFHTPAEISQTAAVLCPTLGKPRICAALAKLLGMRLRVLATVCVDDRGLLKRRLATYAANG